MTEQVEVHEFSHNGGTARVKPPVNGVFQCEFTPFSDPWHSHAEGRARDEAVNAALAAWHAFYGLGGTPRITLLAEGKSQCAFETPSGLTTILGSGDSPEEAARDCRATADVWKQEGKLL